MSGSHNFPVPLAGSYYLYRLLFSQRLSLVLLVMKTEFRVLYPVESTSHITVAFRCISVC